MKIPFVVLLVMATVGCTNRQETSSTATSAPASSDLQLADSFFSINLDSAFYYYTKATQSAESNLQKAMAFAYMAYIQSEAGDYYGSQESALAGLRLIDEKDPASHYCLASLYEELAKANAWLKNYKAALEYHDLAVNIQPNNDYKALSLNSKAVTYKKMGDFEKAIPLYAASLASQEENSIEYARVLSNLAYAKWRADSSYNPLPELFRALEIRLRENNSMGVVTSYNHLTDYYSHANRDSALYYARKMYPLAVAVNNSDDKISALQKLLHLSPPSEWMKYFDKYQLLNDSIQVARLTAKNQFALVRYRLEESKAENLLLQQDNAVKQLAILRQRVTIIAIAIAAIIIVTFLVWWYRKKKHRIEQASADAIRENKLKTSQKVHDVVANGLYRVMTEIEHSDKIDKELLLDKVEELYERSRDLSYEPVSPLSDIQEKITNLLHSFSSKATRVSVVGNNKETWNKTSSQVITELQHVLQELMVNMTKHSGARNVVIRFEQAGDTLTILYKDDGKGLPGKFIIGNGLTSTENRIREIGGEFTFTNHSAGGMAVKITVPNNIP